MNFQNEFFVKLHWQVIKQMRINLLYILVKMSNKDILDNEMNVVILEISNFLSIILILHINLIYKDFSLYQHKGNKKWYHFQSVKFSSKVHKVKF